MFRYRKIAAAVCLAATITACVVVQPVRAFISEALSIFRVESVKGFRISLAELEEIRRKLEQKDGEIDIEAVGRIKREGFREQRVSMDEARAAAGFPVLFPTDAVDELLEIRAVEPGTISFMLKIGSMNEVLGALGARTLLPQSLDGKTLTAVFAYQLDFKYNKGGNTFRVSQTISPELVVPADVDVDEMYECMAELPILPEDVQRQLKSIKDWKNTVYLPVVDAEPQEADINGAKGFIAEKRNSGCILVWYDGGAIYSVEGSAGLEETLDFARGMR